MLDFPCKKAHKQFLRVLDKHNPNNPPIGKWIHKLQNALISDNTRLKLVLEQPPISGNKNAKKLEKHFNAIVSTSKDRDKSRLF